MRITISVAPANSSEEERYFNLDLSNTTTIADLKALIDHEIQIPPGQQLLYFNDSILTDGKQTLEQAGISNDDMLSLTALEGPGAASSGGGRDPSREAEAIRQQLLSNPAKQAQLREQQPQLAAALHNPSQWAAVWEEMRRAREAEIAAMNDPFNIEGQAKIEEMIRQGAVQENLQTALEKHPESFGKVHMLYIDVEVNKVQVKAFVDSGAQATIMSMACAKRCGIQRLIDERYAGIARGVGTAKIIGRVHSAQLKIGGHDLPCTFTVMEQDVELLLGLDMLRRHQAKIDLQNDVLIFNDTPVPFLPENEIPKYMEDAVNKEGEPTVDGPDGAKLGAVTGAVVRPPQGQQKGKTSFQEQGRSLGGASGAQSSSSAAAQPAARPAVPQASKPVAAPPSGSKYPRAIIEQLMQLGFSEPQVIQALDAAQGNVDLAAGYLFG